MSNSRHIFNDREFNNLSSILSKYDAPRQQPTQRSYDTLPPIRSEPQAQMNHRSQYPEQAPQRAQGQQQRTLSNQTMPPQKPAEPDGPKPLDSFANMSGGFGGGFSGVEISKMGYGCMGEKLPASKVDFKE